MPNQDNQPPWGKKKPQNPDDFVAQILDKIQDFFSEENKPPSPPPNNSGNGASSEEPPSPAAALGKFLSILLAVGLLYGVYSSFFKIAPSEVGVILRLGKYSHTTPSGLHFKFPYIDKLYKVDVERIRKEEFGFGSGSRRFASKRDYGMESLMITADKNVINVAWIVQYRVGDPYSWLFKVANVQQAIRDMSESVTRRIVGNMDFDYVLSNRDLLAASVKQELQMMLDGLFPENRSGVKIGTVQFKDINPPDPVKPAFNEVNEADQDMKRLVNEAQEEYNRVIPKARGSAMKIVEEAHGYKAARINEAKGESQRFRDILAAYKGAPEVTRQRMYLETMKEVLPSVKDVYVLDKNQQGPIPLLNLGKGATRTIQLGK